MSGGKMSYPCPVCSLTHSTLSYANSCSKGCNSALEASEFKIGERIYMLTPGEGLGFKYVGKVVAIRVHSTHLIGFTLRVLLYDISLFGDVTKVDLTISGDEVSRYVHEDRLDLAKS